jgi:hypothetical protein
MSNGKVCASLPSSEAAFSLLQGNAKALPMVFGTTLLRGVLIASGVAALDKFVFGESDLKKIAYRSLAGAFAVEVFVLLYAAYKTRK